jgi:DNA-binding LytR/AlgR family response regulator
MPTALIAEDEPLLADALQAALREVWPALQVLEVAPDGEKAATKALALRPDVLFLDIRMPGLTGLEVCERLADDWPSDTAFPQIVFVTAYDEYAVQAFEARAVDYLMKPVNAQRLGKTCERLQAALATRTAPGGDALAQALQQLHAALPAVRAAAHPVPDAQPLAELQAIKPLPLDFVRAAHGNETRLIRPADVIALEADDKYVVVYTVPEAAEKPAGESLIRTPLKELLPRLDATVFWQVHRSTVINTTHLERARRDDEGRLTVRMRGLTKPLAVSRLYAHLFKAD